MENRRKYSGHGGSNKHSNFAIENCLTLRSASNLPLRALEGFVNSFLNLMDAPILSSAYSCLRKRGKGLDIQYRTKPTKLGFFDIVVESSDLKVDDNGEWHVRKHRSCKRRTWRKLHVAINAVGHDIVSTEQSMVKC
ncbi:transposase [Pseudoalteromonas luteoviolacea]|uniref:transposase n=1 Tax=Pseudoalteromonas luteoviolacea TaxID=43657 RepID=UPI001B36F854|nr:transposase [Pseudoalteromonas luteoviolacea]MBQ4811500.1 transposase [Pseudoalteromonas luteoviolacea]